MLKKNVDTQNKRFFLKRREKKVNEKGGELREKKKKRQKEKKNEVEKGDISKVIRSTANTYKYIYNLYADAPSASDSQELSSNTY